MGIKDFFRSVFSGGAAAVKENEHIDQLALRIYESCSDSADSIISAHKDVGDDRHLKIMLMFMYGLLHLADRVAFGVLRNHRAKVMDRLIIGTAAHAIQALSGPAITRAQKEQLIEDLVGKINTASVAFGQYKNLTAEKDGPAKGTLLWEFGKQFADATGHAMDVAYIYEGSATLIAIFESLGVKEAFVACSTG
jgi:hypothetical protein